MIVYRLTLPRYADDLSGMGASIYGGRWNKVGDFVLYTAQTSSLSILEHLAHIKGTLSLPKYVLSIIEIGDSSVQEALTDLGVSSFAETQKIGSKWIIERTSAVLRVPSVINPLESNLLINPLHNELSIKILDQEWFVYDDRLVRS